MKMIQTTINGITYDNSLIVAAYIYNQEQHGVNSWFSKIVNDSPYLTADQVSLAIDECFDWMILYGEYGETVPGKAGRLFFIYEDAKPMIKDIWDKLYNINTLKLENKNE
jgi:hypothetical protein